MRHLAELAGVLSVHGLQIVETRLPVSSASLEPLRESSRKRSEAWFARMEGAKAGLKFWPSLYEDARDGRCPLIEEILVSEILTRVVAALVTSHGQLRGENELCRLASALFHESQTARHLVLQEMLEMADAKDPAVRKLDRLRRTAERWTDLLLGPIHCQFAIRQFVFDASRSREYGQTMLPHLAMGGGSGLFSAGLRTAFPETLRGVPAHAGLHREFAAAVLAWLPAEIFAADGGLLPLRTVRAERPDGFADAAPWKSAAAGHTESGEKSTKPQLPKLSFHQLRLHRHKP